MGRPRTRPTARSTRRPRTQASQRHTSVTRPRKDAPERYVARGGRTSTPTQRGGPQMLKRGSVDSPRHLRERDSGILCSICHNGEETQRSCSPARCNTTRQARSMVWVPNARRSRNVTARPASDKREGYFTPRFDSCHELPRKMNSRKRDRTP